MNTTRRPQSAFLAVTLITVIAVTTVFMVYAAILATYYGSNVTVSQPGGAVEYNLSNTSNSSWTGSLSIINGTAWYARINITNTGSQAVTLRWILQLSGVDQSNPVNTTITLSGGTRTVYATGTGVFSSNYNWGQLTSTGGTYRVKVEVNG